MFQTRIHTWIPSAVCFVTGFFPVALAHAVTQGNAHPDGLSSLNQELTSVEFRRQLLADKPLTISERDWKAGWIALFDGDSLYGWRSEGDADFHVDEGRIIATTGSSPCLLRTTSQFGNYQLRIRFLADRDTNSGVFLHTAPRPKSPTVDCYELNIASADNPFPTGSLVGRARYASGDNRVEWETFDVFVLHDQVTVSLNGEEILEYRDAKPLLKGFIGLQFNSGAVAFDQVWLRPLSMQSLFDGKDLTAWRTFPEMDGEFAIDDQQTLHVTNGPGQLETKDRYRDFVLQLEARTNAPFLNSGVFFRCLPGERMNGYESQIHNGYEGGDRTIPKDFGTGGIFRRKPARRVNADDETWFAKTIIADGRHIATWVNGIQVCDWTDQRERDPNPRRGLRTEAGTIMIQAHDPTTDLNFRNIRIAETESRNR